MDTSAEKRRHPRIARELDLSLVLRPRAPGSRRGLHLHTRDISLTGISVILPEPIRPDTDVELWLTLDEGEPLCHLLGTVAWCGQVAGQWHAGIALELDGADGPAWQTRFTLSL